MVSKRKARRKWKVAASVGPPRGKRLTAKIAKKSREGRKEKGGNLLCDLCGFSLRSLRLMALSGLQNIKRGASGLQTANVVPEVVSSLPDILGLAKIQPIKLVRRKRKDFLPAAGQS